MILDLEKWYEFSEVFYLRLIWYFVLFMVAYTYLSKTCDFINVYVY